MPEGGLVFGVGFTNAWDWLAGDDEEVGGRLRVDVAEGDAEVVLVFELTRYFTVHDFFEEGLHNCGVRVTFVLVWRVGRYR